MTTLRVMTFNLRGAVIPDGINAWPKRAELNARTILKYAPDLIGFQEVQDGNLESYTEKLPGFDRFIGPRYNNRDPHAYPSIFWNPERLEQIGRGEFWLSTTPEVFSGDWETDCIRSAAWSKFRVRSNGATFIHLNTHLDHISAKARFEGSRVILEKLRQPIDKNEALVLTGDFNCNPGSEPYRLFTDHGFVDTFSAAGNRDGEDVYTYHEFTGERQEGMERIDWILLRGGNRALRALSCAIIRDAEPPLFPSDHYPVLSEIEISPGVE